MENGDICRICLAKEPVNDIHELEVNLGCQNYIKIMQFCLDIQVVEGSKIGEKLCSKCFKKVISFHKFKTLALQNDAYIRTLCGDEEVKEEITEIKSEQGSITTDELDTLKNEFCISEEPTQHYESEDELLSVLKEIKYELDVESTKEKVTIKRKRGRPKSVKKDVVPNKSKMCEECGMKVNNLKEHLLSHKPVEDRKQIKCLLCDSVFSSYSARYKHNQRKHLGIKQQCKICDKYVSNLKSHHKVVHEPSALQFACVSCERRFISRSSLAAHVTAHTQARPFECDACHKKFRTKLSLVSHTRQVHDKEKSHLCQFCSKSFFKKYHLQIHLRSHTKEKPCECPDCGKFFASTTILKNHRLTHATVKAFECKLCDMSFVRSGYLNAHMISHTKEKRHACQYCGVKFGRSDHRKRHERTAHELRNNIIQFDENQKMVIVEN